MVSRKFSFFHIHFNFTYKSLYRFAYLILGMGATHFVISCFWYEGTAASLEPLLPVFSIVKQLLFFSAICTCSFQISDSVIWLSVFWTPNWFISNTIRNCCFNVLQSQNELGSKFVEAIITSTTSGMTTYMDYLFILNKRTKSHFSIVSIVLYLWTNYVCNNFR